MKQQEKRELELMETMWHLTLDFKEQFEHDGICGDDEIEFLNKLAHRFNGEVYSDGKGSFLEQLEEFEKKYTREAVISRIEKGDRWLNRLPEKIGGRVINHIYCDGTEDGSYIADEPNGIKNDLSSKSDEADVWFFDELSLPELVELEEKITLLVVRAERIEENMILLAAHVFDAIDEMSEVWTETVEIIRGAAISFEETYDQKGDYMEQLEKFERELIRECEQAYHEECSCI